MMAEDPGLLEQVRRKQATEKLSRRGAMTKDNQQGLLQRLIQRPTGSGTTFLRLLF